MAIIKVVSTGSIGNSYILETEKEILLIELGVKWKDILKGLNYDISKVTSCLVSHIHIDHSKSIRNALSYQIPVYSNREVADKFKGVKVLDYNRKYKIGGFKVQPIAVEHNAMNYAYLIEHEEFGRLLFITDAIRFPYRIKGINHLIVESNYDEDIIINKLCEGFDIRSRSEYHMEIKDTLECIRNTYNSSLMNVILVHLSDGMSDEERFVKLAKEEAPMSNVFAAKRGLVVELNKEEF